MIKLKDKAEKKVTSHHSIPQNAKSIVTYGYKGALSPITLFLIRCPRERLYQESRIIEKKLPFVIFQIHKKRQNIKSY